VILFWLIPGLFLPTLAGVLAIRILEGRAPVLFKFERITLGFVLGVTLTMFITFFAQILTGIKLTVLSHLIIQISTVIAIVLLYKITKNKSNEEKKPAASAGNKIHYSLFTIHYSFLTRSIILILIVWSLLKIILSSATFLVLTPSFLDDAVDNWNLRGKVFFTERRIKLDLPNEKGETEIYPLSAYPPTVPLIKAELSAFAGKWDEGLINSIHLLWYLSTIILVYFAIKRSAGGIFALLGAYMLTSIPLYLMHGTNPYADAFLSAHIFAAISMVYFAVTADNPEEKKSFLRLGALSAALLIFTKNEALLIHLPVILAITAVSLFWLKKKNKLQTSECVKIIYWYSGFVLAVALPWIIFKLANGFAFGNAQALSGIKLSWHPGIMKAVFYNTFLEGNWLLLFPLLLILLVIRRKDAFKTPLLVLTAFLLIIYFGQMPLYMFTFLYTEAVNQTGYSRGLVQIVPIIVMLAALLLEKLIRQEQV